MIRLYTYRTFSSTSMKEEYKDISLVLEKLKYKEYCWQICLDLKMVNFLLGQQAGCTKYPYFICLWNNRDKNNNWT